MKEAKGQTSAILIQFNNYGFYHKMQELNQSKPFAPLEGQWTSCSLETLPRSSPSGQIRLKTNPFFLQRMGKGHLPGMEAEW